MEAEKLEAAKKAAERPLPPVPEIVVDQSHEKIASSMKKKKTRQIKLSWFTEKKAVRFSTADVFEVNQDDDEDVLNDTEDDDDDDDEGGDKVVKVKSGAKKPDDDLSVYSPKYRSPRSVAC